jgi:predicted ABC-type ATPase
VIIAGPNGGGKTTISRAVLADTLGIEHFVNADAIAAGLSGFSPEAASFPAGRIMLARLRELATARESFAFESTLASRTFAPWLRGCVGEGYRVSLVYVMLRSARLATMRVGQRVRLGGHSVLDADVRRRFHR